MYDIIFGLTFFLSLLHIILNLTFLVSLFGTLGRVQCLLDCIPSVGQRKGHSHAVWWDPVLTENALRESGSILTEILSTISIT